MKPGDRVKTIKRVADLMAPWDWTDIDLTLEQFGLPTSDSWDGNDRRGYVVQMVRNAQDGPLVDLLGFVSPDQETDLDLNSQPSPWLPGYFKLFGSHITADKEFVSQVKRQLGRWAVDLFVAHQDIKPSKQWVAEIELALDSCDALAAFLTAGFHESYWTDQEVGYATRRRVPIIPICMGAMPYGFMARNQGLRAEKLDPAELAEAIFMTLAANPLTAGRLAEAVTNYVADADSFARAIRGSELFPFIEQWDPTLLRRLEESIESNYEVTAAFKVPARIRDLIAKHRHS